jgi:hypothetical protein
VRHVLERLRNALGARRIDLGVCLRGLIVEAYTSGIVPGGIVGRLVGAWGVGAGGAEVVGFIGEAGELLGWWYV